MTHTCLPEGQIIPLFHTQQQSQSKECFFNEAMSFGLEVCLLPKQTRLQCWFPPQLSKSHLPGSSCDLQMLAILQNCRPQMFPGNTKPIGNKRVKDTREEAARTPTAMTLTRKDETSGRHQRLVQRILTLLVGISIRDNACGPS